MHNVWYYDVDLSSLHWPILLFFYAFFVQWCILPTIEKHIFFKCSTLTRCSFVSYIIVLPKEMLLSFSIGTFLTINNVTNKKLNTSWYTALCENEQFESKIIQWRLLLIGIFKGPLVKRYKASVIGTVTICHSNGYCIADFYF